MHSKWSLFGKGVSSILTGYGAVNLIVNGVNYINRKREQNWEDERKIKFSTFFYDGRREPVSDDKYRWREIYNRTPVKVDRRFESIDKYEEVNASEHMYTKEEQEKDKQILMEKITLELEKLKYTDHGDVLMKIEGIFAKNFRTDAAWNPFLLKMMASDPEIYEFFRGRQHNDDDRNRIIKKIQDNLSSHIELHETTIEYKGKQKTESAPELTDLPRPR